MARDAFKAKTRMNLLVRINLSLAVIFVLGALGDQQYTAVSTDPDGQSSGFSPARATYVQYRRLLVDARTQRPSSRAVTG
jgi:hypothetical protein